MAASSNILGTNMLAGSAPGINSEAMCSFLKALDEEEIRALSSDSWKLIQDQVVAIMILPSALVTCGTVMFLAESMKNQQFPLKF
ncbi:hypothetical protein [Candidatus Neptunochlamydia vexilliferae]|uniref:Uncharacterized protein n=1 Tax=Candidatus Neptunichlamydia vexilliferae TaxID=1651774 RepID=A0ABS0B0Z7_9BACT|nr:hypothetical protein [Candidatus Neptunochlamydia vexilliferae]MBF5060065.1 hypothetical protein [Candidatus Neptunochlamydia vexilliferae]